MRDPIKEDFEGSLTQELQAIHQMNNGIVRVSSARYAHEAGTGIDDGAHHADNRYFGSSSIDDHERVYYAQQVKSCSCSNNEGNSNGHECLRCKKNQGGIIKRRDYFSSSSAGGHSSSSFSSGREGRCRRRIDK